MKIAIKFHDNDFYHTFYGVLEMLFNSFKHSDNLTDNKERLCFLINSLAPLAYVTYQNPWEYNGLEDAVKTEENKEFIHTKNYLTITSDRILVNEEVDEYLANTSWNNSETFILDTTLYNNNIYTI